MKTKCDCTWGSYCPTCHPEAFSKQEGQPSNQLHDTPEYWETLQECARILGDIVKSRDVTLAQGDRAEKALYKITDFLREAGKQEQAIEFACATCGWRGKFATDNLKAAQKAHCRASLANCKGTVSHA